MQWCWALSYIPLHFIDITVTSLMSKFWLFNTQKVLKSEEHSPLHIITFQISKSLPLYIEKLAKSEAFCRAYYYPIPSIANKNAFLLISSVTLDIFKHLRTWHIDWTVALKMPISWPFSSQYWLPRQSRWTFPGDSVTSTDIQTPFPVFLDC